MPRYEFICDHCGEETDLIVSFSEADKKQPCTGCGNKKGLSRVEMAGSAVINTKGGYQSGYVMGDGQRLPGTLKSKYKGTRAKKVK